MPLFKVGDIVKLKDDSGGNVMLIDKVLASCPIPNCPRQSYRMSNGEFYFENGLELIHTCICSDNG